MAYLSDAELKKLNFKFLGNNVQISDKASIYNHDKIEIGNNSRIDDFCVISGKIKIGSFVHIAPHCLLAGGTEGIIMEDFSGFAYFVQAFSQSDDYSGQTLTNPTVSSKFKKEFKSKILIKKHVIVGSGSIIFPGVTIEEGCSIGAHALVKKDTSPWGVYVGNPAKRIKERKKDLLLLEDQFLKEVKNDSI